MARVVFWGLLAAVLFSLENMCTKWLMVSRNYPGDISGVFFFTIEGFLGTVCLIVTTLMGSGLHELSTASIFTLLGAAAMAFSALVCLTYSISTGNVAISVSIFNSSAAIQALLSSLFLGQLITSWQVVGIVVCLFGACTCSVGDMVFDSLFKKAPVDATKDGK